MWEVIKNALEFDNMPKKRDANKRGLPSVSSPGPLRVPTKGFGSLGDEPFTHRSLSGHVQKLPKRATSPIDVSPLNRDFEMQASEGPAPGSAIKPGRAIWVARRVFYASNYWLRIALGGARKGNKAWFEYIYSKRDNPWNNDASKYELAKYERTLSFLPRSHYRNVLEIGCSVGAFTSLIAKRADTVHGIDISCQAIERARKQCGHLNHVNFAMADLLKFESDRQYDLICAAEVLYFMARNEAQIVGVVERIASLLAYGGQVCTVCAGKVDRQNNWEEYFPRYCDELRLVSTEIVRDPFRDYRISLFEKRHSSLPEASLHDS